MSVARVGESLSVADRRHGHRGAGWLTTLSSLILAAQRGAAEWVRGRALSISTLTLYGSLAIGALLWGTIATRAGTQWALTGAGIALVLGLGLIPRFRLATAEAGNLENTRKTGPIRS